MSNSIDISGTIDSSHVIRVAAALDSLKNCPISTLTVNIDSAGGDPDPAKQIYDMILPQRARVTTVAHKKCMSSAVIIFLSGSSRHCYSYTDFMVHPTSWTLWGMYSFMRSYQSPNGNDLTLTLSEVYTIQGQLNKALSRLNEIEDYTDAIFAAETKMTRQQISNRRLINSDCHYTAEQSLAYGISTKII
jgi:ATP-dependent protease ClpP protease subunit